MNEKTARVLEYNKITAMLAEQASSPMAKEKLSSLAPLTDAREIRDLLAETSEAVSVIRAKGPLPLGGLGDVKNALYFARKGGTLTMKQLLEVHRAIAIARGVVAFMKGDMPDTPIVSEMTGLLEVPKALEEDIDRCILSEDEMADNASSELRNIRRAMSRQNEAVKARLNQIINSQNNKTILQDAIVTLRQGRYVIPVKQEHRASFPGIVHDQSASGSTLFIEPQVIVEMNNELRELELAEKAEMNRILAELSGRVAEHFHELLNNQELLVKLDVIFARGKLSEALDCTEPLVTEDLVMELRGARHPLIDPKKVVPITVSLGDGYDTLIITGPNTGGKTVTLKTVGLLAMMAQSGLRIPANEGTRMPVFEKIFADIGDEQSIEQSLSTFSSHMTNIVSIVKETGPGTLALVDELGAGTDPTEGAALAISILEELRSRGARTIATTHYTELKKYAISAQGVQNASMEFSVETLSPTYRLITGVPGKSNAFEIASKLGLDDRITDKARRLLDSDDIRFEEVISAIENEKKAAEAERSEAAAIGADMRRRSEELEAQARKAQTQKEKLLADAREEARRIIQEAKDVSAEVRAELRELSKVESLGERNKRFEENTRRLRDTEKKYRETITYEDNRNPVSADEVRIGDRVKVLAIGQNGEVVSVPDDKGDLFVQVGAMKMNVNVDGLMKIDSGGVKKSGKTKYGNMYRVKTQTVPISINVVGENLDSARADVDKYLDDAYMAQLKEVTIVHGRGEGILSKGLREMLRSHRLVESYRRGGFSEGGDGVTVVKLKEK